MSELKVPVTRTPETFPEVKTYHICYDPCEGVWFLEQKTQTSEFQAEIVSLSCHKSYKAASAALRLIQAPQEDS